MTKLPIMREASCAFCILTWNSASYIDRCLDSVLRLPFREVRAFVFDNGSTDGTPEHIASRYKGEVADGKVVLVRADSNIGTTRSRNALLSRVPEETDYVCVLDSDTEVYPAAFEAMCAHFSTDGDAGIGVMGPRMRNDEGELQFSGRSLPTLPIKLGKGIPVGFLRLIAADAEVCDTPVRRGLQDVGYLLSACWLLPYSTYREVGPLDEEIFYAPEDVDWCARVHKAGLRVVLAHDAEILHAYQRLSHKKLISRTNASHVRGLAHYFVKHRYLFRSKRVWDPAAAWTR